MLKSTTIIVVLLFSGIFEVAEPKQSFLTGEKANKLLAQDEDKKKDEITQIENRLSLIEEQLQIWPILKDLGFGLVIKKFIDVPMAMINLLRRYHYQGKLKEAKAKQKQDTLLQQNTTGEKLCKAAFDHDFFKTNLRWSLVENDEETQHMKSKSIHVKIEVGGKTKSFSRNTKICMARPANSDPENKNEQFPVYLSGVHDFKWYRNFAFFVFTKHSSYLILSEFHLEGYVSF